MNEVFELPVHYHGKEHELPARLHVFGLSYKIEVELNGSFVFFERDEERNWRAIADGSNIDQNADEEVLKAVIVSLDELF